MGSDISSCFLRRLQKTADFGTSAVVGKAVIRQAFIRQRPASIWAHLATTPDSRSLESLAILANRALASENDVKYSCMGVAQIQLNDNERIIRIMEDISRHLKLQAHRKNNKPQTDNRANRTAGKQTVLPNANAKPFILRIAKNNNNGQNVLPASQSVPRPTALPPKLQQSNIAQPLATDDAQVCYYHQRFGDKARSCRDHCAFALNFLASARGRHLRLASRMRHGMTVQSYPS